VPASPALGRGMSERPTSGNGANGKGTTLTAKEFKSDQEVRWCPGCGDYAILASVQAFMPELGFPREKIVFVSGIGCAARFPYYMQTYGMHSIHGRAPAIATGLATSRPDLSVWVVGGDGDMLSIGGNHLIHALRRNVNLKLLLFNNQVYGIGAEATFVARAIDTDRKHVTEVLRRAAAHRGAAFVEILQNCNIYNDGAFDAVREDEANRIYLRHGEPVRFGADRERGVVARGDGSVEIVEVAGVGEDALLVHDEHHPQPSLAFALSRLTLDEVGVAPVGVLRDVEEPVYDDLMAEQIETSIEQRGEGDLTALLHGNDTWTIS